MARCKFLKINNFSLSLLRPAIWQALLSGPKPPTRCRWTVWKYGQTTNPATRYSDAQLNGGLAGRRLFQVTQYRGTRRQVLLAEKLKIYTHLAETGALPPGNKIRR